MLLELTRGEGVCTLTLAALPMGHDWNVSITGGAAPHIGAAALGVPYRKPDGTFGASVSVLTIPTHKEDLLARNAADQLARQLGCTVLVSCGIHLDGITPEGISAFCGLVEELVAALPGEIRRAGLD